MSDPPRLPLSLKIVAWLFLLSGISSVIEVIVGLMGDRLHVDLGILNLFAGWGLLRLRPGWRTYALVLLWIAMIAMPLAGIAFMLMPGPVTFRIMNFRVGQFPLVAARLMGLALAALLFALTVWQYRVLTRPNVWRLFHPSVLACAACGYDLRGNVTGRCPECGAEVPPEVRRKLGIAPQAN